jgi:hypothetical protein
MNTTFDIKRFDQKIHHWEHDLLISSEKLMHNAAFWAIVAVCVFATIMTLLSIFAPAGATPVNPYNMPYFLIH